MLSATLHEWKRKIEQLQQRWRGARQENERLRKENEVLRRREKQWESEREQWERERKRLERERERLRGEIDNLKRQLEEAQRANKRQAAPFSRGTRKEHPKTPGRKPGAAYGRRYCKLPPKQVDEIVPVPLPRRCSCRGRVVFDRTESQYQQEIVRKTIWRRFDIDIGHCEKCHKRVQGRDSRQTSDALGAAKVQLGPEALALAVRMNKDLAMPHADVAAVLRDGFQLQVNRSTIARAVDRAKKLIESASARAARFPLRVQEVFKQALALAERYKNKEISLHGLLTATGRLEVKLDRVLNNPGRDPANRRFRNHLDHERPYLFTFLYCPGLDATNNVSERAIRALIGARKNWGGNRTPRGARAQAVLTSILQTAKQQGKKPFAVLLELLCGRDQHKILDLVPGTREATPDSSRAAKAGGRLLSSTPESAVPRELLALHATSPPVGPVSAAVQP